MLNNECQNLKLVQYEVKLTLIQYFEDIMATNF